MPARAHKTRQLYQGCDWQTYRYGVAQMFDCLDQVRAVTNVLLAGEATALGMGAFTASPWQALQAVCNDLTGAVDMVMAEIASGYGTGHAARWQMAELRLWVGGLPVLAAESDSDSSVLPILANQAEHIRHMLHQLDAH